MSFNYLVEKVFNTLLAFFLGLMGLLIFSNVFLRYLFNEGLTWAEELSRFLFVWLVFLGAIAAMKNNSHLGFQMLVQKLPPDLKKVAFVLSNLVVLFCLGSIFIGSLQMAEMTTNTLSPATGIPLAYLYGIGVISGGSMFFFVCVNMYKTFFGTETVPPAVLSTPEEGKPLSAIESQKEKKS